MSQEIPEWIEAAIELATEATLAKFLSNCEDCGDEIIVSPSQSYRCFHCDECFCSTCAEKHFQSVEKLFAARIDDGTVQVDFADCRLVASNDALQLVVDSFARILSHDALDGDDSLVAVVWSPPLRLDVNVDL